MSYYQNLLFPTPFVSTSDSLTIGAKYSGWGDYTRIKDSIQEPILVFKTTSLQGVDFRAEFEISPASMDREIGIFNKIPVQNLTQIICGESQVENYQSLLKRFQNLNVELLTGSVKSDFLKDYSGCGDFEVEYYEKYEDNSKMYKIPNILEVKKV